VVHDKDVGDVVDESQEEDQHDQSEELLVVGLAYTVVQPPAVVIKVVHAAVARAAMFCRLGHMCLTNVTFELVA
jgi:hypothetical protein